MKNSTKGKPTWNNRIHPLYRTASSFTYHIILSQQHENFWNILSLVTILKQSHLDFTYISQPEYNKQNVLTISTIIQIANCLTRNIANNKKETLFCFLWLQAWRMVTYSILGFTFYTSTWVPKRWSQTLKKCTTIIIISNNIIYIHHDDCLTEKTYNFLKIAHVYSQFGSGTSLEVLFHLLVFQI